MEPLEERTIEKLPDRCQNCGATLTDAGEGDGARGGRTVILCTTCAAEAEPLPEEAEEFEDACGVRAGRRDDHGDPLRPRLARRIRCWRSGFERTSAPVTLTR